MAQLLELSNFGSLPSKAGGLSMIIKRGPRRNYQEHEQHGTKEKALIWSIKGQTDTSFHFGTLYLSF